jgi:Fic family protein
MTNKYQPPFTITPEIVSLVADISGILGRLLVLQNTPALLRLHRANRIRTIHGSLAIEGNTLNEDQITAILAGKRVLAPPREIQEARNAILVYDQLGSWKAHNISDLLNAHGVLMAGLVDAPGTFRSAGVGIMKGQEVFHLAPPADRVPVLVKDLLAWFRTTKDHPLIASSVFYYEFEFIHPFPDGNDRLGRLWQTLILSQWNPLFTFIPVVTMVHRNQAEYYKAINKSTANADSGTFIHFMLRMIHEAVQEAATVSEKMSEKTSEKILRHILENNAITIAALAVKTGLTIRTIERNLNTLQHQGRLIRIGPDKGGSWNVLGSKKEAPHDSR